MTDRKFSSKRPLTDQEEAEIQRMIASDPDAPELTDDQLAQAKPFTEAFPALAESIRRMRGPQKAPTKQLISLRVSRDVLERFKADGPGWQARMDETLRKAVGL